MTNQFQVWLLPVIILVLTTALAIPASRFFAWIMDGKLPRPAPLRWIESRLNTGPQRLETVCRGDDAVQFGDVPLRIHAAGLAAEDRPGAESRGQGDARPDDDLQYDDVVPHEHEPAALFAASSILSYFSQIFFVIWNMFLSASVGFCGLVAIIRATPRRPAHGQLLH